MATEISCDQCGKDGAFENTVDISRFCNELKGPMPRWKFDLCVTCYSRLVDLLNSALPPNSFVKR